MRPLQPQLPAASDASSPSSSSSAAVGDASPHSTNRSRQQQRPDLSLPLPQRDPHLAIPLPLSPSSAPSSTLSLSSPSSSSSAAVGAASPYSANRNRPQRRPDLSLPLPQRDPHLAVPLPLPPSSSPSPTSSSSPSSSSSAEVGAASPYSANSNCKRRRPDLSLPLPQRDLQHFAVPLPLPPSSAPISTSSSSFFSTLPTRIHFWELERINRIGSGSGGTVYKVLHRPSGKFYALKVIYGHHDDSVRLQISREIKILQEVDNPNVIKCHDMFDHNGDIHVLLEYMDKGSLEGTHIPHEPSLADLTRQILLGLYYLHRRKIVHRDIKPSNFLINSQRVVKIADFGVSQILERTMDPCNSSVGTIEYMSPERINTDISKGQYNGYAGDIWSLGVSILEFYLGKFPFNVERQGDWATLMCAICMSPPPEAPSTASREFRDFIACCLQRDPTKRWTVA